MRIEINPNKEFVRKIEQALKDNDYFCPCQINRNEDTKCMCKDFREMDEGTCHCGYFIKYKD